MKTALIVVVVLAVLGGGAVALTHKSKTSTNQAPQSSNQSPSSNQPSKTSTTTDQNAGDTIVYSDNGFSPSTITVKAGATITLKNTSSHGLQFDSDPHPAHTDDPELNVGIVDSGKSASFTIQKTGSHGYHNHLNPSDTGTIIVQ